jgi:hypothetical protein
MLDTTLDASRRHPPRPGWEERLAFDLLSPDTQRDCIASIEGIGPALALLSM